MNKIIEYICAWAPKLIQSEPPCVGAFMDDLFLKSATLNDTKNVNTSSYCFALGKGGNWKIMVFDVN